MAVVGGDDDQGVLVAAQLTCHGHSLGKGDGVSQRAEGIAGVVGVVDAAGFHHQVVAIVVVLQQLDGSAGHLGQAGFTGPVLRPVGFEFHVGRLEQAQHRAGILQVQRVKLGLIPHITSTGPGQPFLGQIAAVGALARQAGIFRIRSLLRLEETAAAAQHHVDAVAMREFQQLARDVLHRGACWQLGIALPVAVADVGVVRRGRGVGDAGGRDDARGHAALFRQFQNGRDTVRGDHAGVDLVVRHHLGNRQRAVIGLDARHHGSGGGCRVGCLLIGAGRDGVGQPGQALEAQAIAFTVHLALLTFEDARGSDSRNAHAVAHEKNDIARLARVWRAGAGGLQRLLALGEPCGSVGGLRYGGRAADNQKRQGKTGKYAKHWRHPATVSGKLHCSRRV